MGLLTGNKKSKKDEAPTGHQYNKPVAITFDFGDAINPFASCTPKSSSYDDNNGDGSPSSKSVRKLPVAGGAGGFAGEDEFEQEDEEEGEAPVRPPLLKAGSRQALSRQSRCDPMAATFNPEEKQHQYQAMKFNGGPGGGQASFAQPVQPPIVAQPPPPQQHHQQSYQPSLPPIPQQQPLPIPPPLSNARPHLPPGSMPPVDLHHEQQHQHASPSTQFPPNTAFQQMHLLMAPGGGPAPAPSPFGHPPPPPTPQHHPVAQQHQQPATTMDLNPSHYSLLTQTQPLVGMDAFHQPPPPQHYQQQYHQPQQQQQQFPPPPPQQQQQHFVQQPPPPAPSISHLRPSPSTTTRPMSYPSFASSPPATQKPPKRAPSVPTAAPPPVSIITVNTVKFNNSFEGAAPPPSLIPKRGKSCLRLEPSRHDPLVNSTGQTVPWAGVGGATPGGAPPRPRSAPPVAGSLRNGAQLLHRLNVLLGSGSGMVERFVDVKEVLEPGRVCAMQPEVGSGAAGKKNQREKAFGLPLEMAPEGSICQTVIGAYSHKIPFVVFAIVEEIFKRGMSTPGIFRLVGDSARCLNLYSVFNFGPTFGGSLDVGNEPIHNLCGVLKLYLRELPEPLVHPSIWKGLLSLCVEPNQKEVVIPEATRIAAAQILLRLMPPRYFSLLVYLLAFLTEVPKFENRLTQTSVSIIFGPMLVAPRGFGIPSIGPSDQPLKVAPPPTNPDGTTATPRPSQDHSGLVGQSQAILLWLTTNWEALSDGLFDLDLDIGDAADNQVRIVGTVEQVPPPSALNQQQQLFREPELVNAQQHQQQSIPPPSQIVRQLRKPGASAKPRPQSWAPSNPPPAPPPASRYVPSVNQVRRESDNETLNGDDGGKGGPGGYFVANDANSKAAVKAKVLDSMNLSSYPYPTSQDEVTHLLALLQDKDRELNLYKQEANHREALVGRLTSSVDALSRELEAANKRAGGSGEESFEDEWRVKCRDMEFQKNRVTVELSNAKFKVQELTEQLEASKKPPPAPSHESTLPQERQHQIAIGRLKVKLSDLLGEVEKERNEKMEMSSRLNALLAQR